MYIILALIVFSQTALSQVEVPKCMSSFDYNHNLLYKLIKIEEEVKGFRNILNKLKKRKAQTEEEQNEKLQKALEVFKNTTEEQLQQTAANYKSALQQEMDKWTASYGTTSKPQAIGFNAQGPAESVLNPGSLTYNAIITNTGDSFDKSTGTFTCNVAGFYFFSMSLIKPRSYDGYTKCFMYRNRDILTNVYIEPGSTPKTGYYTGSNGAYVHLDVGDTVKVKGCTKIASLYAYSSFSGFLVTPDAN